MDAPITTFDVAGLTAEIHIDLDCDSPRTVEPLGTIVAWHRRYALADDPTRFPTPDDFHAYVKRAKPPLVLPLYLYDHSGLALATTSFSDPWDSGQVGYVYATKRAIRRVFGDVSDATLARANDLLIDEVREYSAYVNGECYGYVLRDATGAVRDACWGFIGYESVEEAAREATEHAAHAALQSA